MGNVFWVIAIFLVVGGYMIYNSQKTDFNDPGSTFNFAKELSGWIFQVGKSTFNTAGYAFTQDWMPKTNQTNTTNISSFK